MKRNEEYNKQTNCVEQNEKKQITWQNKLEIQLGQNRESWICFVLTSFMGEFCYNGYQKVQPFVLLSLFYFYKKVPGAFFTWVGAYDTLVCKVRYKLWRFRLAAVRSKAVPSLQLRFQNAPGACLCIDSVHILHLSTNWDTSCDGSAWQMASEK